MVVCPNARLEKNKTITIPRSTINPSVLERVACNIMYPLLSQKKGKLIAFPLFHPIFQVQNAHKDYLTLG